MRKIGKGRKFFTPMFKKFRTMLRKNFCKQVTVVPTKFYDNDTFLYLTVNYPAGLYSYISDDKVGDAFKKCGLDKYFDESGSGCGFGKRDIGWSEKGATNKSKAR